MGVGLFIQKNLSSGSGDIAKPEKLISRALKYPEFKINLTPGIFLLQYLTIIFYCSNIRGGL